MKKSIVLFAALAMGAISANAQEAAPAVSVTSSFGYESEYVFRGVQLADAIITPAIDVAYGDFYAGVWFAAPIENADLAGVSDNEMDLYVGYSTALSDLLTVDFGATRYAYGDVATKFLSNGNTLEGYAGISADVFLSPSVYVYYDIDLKSFCVELSGGYSYELSDKFSADFGASVGYVDVDSSDDYYYGGLTADLSYAINDASSMGFGVRYSTSDMDQVVGSFDDPKADKDIFWYGFTFSTGF